MGSQARLVWLVLAVFLTILVIVFAVAFLVAAFSMTAANAIPWFVALTLAALLGLLFTVALLVTGKAYPQILSAFPQLKPSVN